MMSVQEQEAEVKKLIEDGQFREAAVACDALNLQFPEYEPGWYTASRLAMMVKEPVLAVRAIDRALQLSPGKPEWLFQKLACQTAAGAVQNAKETAGQLAGYEFQTVEFASGFAQTLTHLGMPAEAQRHYARAAELAPDDGQHFYNLATVNRILGNVDAADAALSRCLELTPDDTRAHSLRAGIRTQTQEQNNVDALKAAHLRADEKPRRRARLCYSLSKELEDIGNYSESFDYLNQGSLSRRADMQYDLQNDLDAFQRIRETYTADLFDGHIEGHINAEPIFIIGMPRTGTNLVDRILANHSVVYSAGKLQSFPIELMKHCQEIDGTPAVRAADRMSRSASVDFALLGEDYIAGTRPGTGKTAHFVDKLPQNFLYAGMIHLALPKARIVLLERDPMDACYAAYKTLFEGGNPYSYDLEELAKYYVAHSQLVNHWQTVMPGVMHVVEYEALAVNPKSVTEGLLSYCGLSWEEACLSFHGKENTATTASVAQSSSELFRSSIGNWRNFEEQLKPVSDILGESQ
jgi:tetratricopeptide (TPR) repeat protein